MLNAFVSGETNKPVIAANEREGAIWLKRPVILSPRFHLHFTVYLDSACWDSMWGRSWAMDGFAVTLSKTTNYVKGGGGSLGYLDIWDAIVGEFDFWQNPEIGDISANTMSIHSCFKRTCNYFESGTKQVNLPFVIIKF